MNKTANKDNLSYSKLSPCCHLKLEHPLSSIALLDYKYRHAVNSSLSVINGSVLLPVLQIFQAKTVGKDDDNNNDDNGDCKKKC